MALATVAGTMWRREGRFANWERRGGEISLLTCDLSAA
jgi:hypothetical protein